MWGFVPGLCELAIDMAANAGRGTTFTKYWVDGEGRLHVADVTDEVYERTPLEAHLVPGTNPPRYET